jgi:hypothetical protein
MKGQAMKMSCCRAQRLLDTWFELGDHDKKRVRSHAEECPVCRRALADTERLFDLLGATREAYRDLRGSEELGPRAQHVREPRFSWAWLWPREVRWALATVSCAATIALVWFALAAVRQESRFVRHPGALSVTTLAGAGEGMSLSKAGAARGAVSIPASMSSVSRMVQEQAVAVKKAHGGSIPHGLRLPRRPAKGGATWLSRGDPDGSFFADV